jgi:hypothetical protein
MIVLEHKFGKEIRLQTHHAREFYSLEIMKKKINDFKKIKDFLSEVDIF